MQPGDALPRRDGSVLKEALDDFKYMIDHAIDREELEDVRQMIREASDLTPHEKKQLVKYWDERYKKAPEQRRSQ